ncbi:hypothetical protein [Methanocella sp.]|uniref:hypothetical protein n=1 Tax=Methanocella sp. TaxID=2052833 RepID=UPI002D8013E6|nr:hypothetical protein [Methanocella sp.]
MAAASVGAVSAGPSLKNLKSGNGGYVVTFGKSSDVSPQSMLVSPMSSMGNTIKQGQTQWAQKTVVGNPTTIYTDVYWGNPTNSISLTVYTPDGYVLGPVYDNIEGIINGDIPLAITRSGGVASGTYYYQIYGYRISGSQYYTFS